MKDKDQEQRVAALEVNEIQKFLGTVDPVKLKLMYKAEASDNRAEYNKIKAELLNEYRRLKE